MFNRSRRNLACWFALSMGSILILFAGVVYYREVQDKLNAFDNSLYAKSKAIANEARYRLEHGEWWLDLAEADLPIMGSSTQPFASEIAYIRWYNNRGQLMQFIGATPPGQLTVAPGFQTIKTDGDRNRATPKEIWLRQVTLPVLHDKDKLLIGYLQIATPLTSLRENLERMRLFLALGVPVTLGLIGITGWFLGGLAMQPIRTAYDQLQRFTADASHELRAPLAAVLSNAQVGILSPVGDGSQQRQRLEKIVETTKSMSALIANLLFLARNEGRLTPEVLKTVNLVSLMQPLLDEYTARADKQNLSFISQLPEQPASLSADPELLKQAVRNLLDNAFKYTPSGGTVRLRFFTQSRRTIIQVEDSGIGIPASDLPHIFERFYRVDVARSRQTGGFGLGLAIAQQIVQAHGGQITAKSVVEKGSTFQIEIP